MMFFVFCFMQYITQSFACENLILSGNDMGTLYFKTMSSTEIEELGATAKLSGGRAAYVAVDEGAPPVYLYHTAALSNVGRGRWVVDGELGSQTSAYAFVDSWTVMPNMVHAVNDPEHSAWQVHKGEDAWGSDDSVRVMCDGDEDRTVYLASEHANAWMTSGFFVQTKSTYGGPLFSRVGEGSDRGQMFMFQFEEKWLIGTNPGADEAYAWVEDSAALPSEITNTDWHYLQGENWVAITTHIIKGDSELNVYARLRQHRTLQFIPDGQDFRHLKHELVLPSIGLGTGNIMHEMLPDTLAASLDAGYRMFDLAREYRNEELMSQVYSTAGDEEPTPTINRNEIFVVTKVWPTDFGFAETSAEVLESLSALKSSYVDLYMIHWPSCNPEWEWMHCETTRDESATWYDSWLALERAFGEGRVMSIGVSNFNVELLEELKQASPVNTFAVQNFAEPGNTDADVVRWCLQNGAAFIPYATIRNLDKLSPEMQQAVQHAAQKNGKTIHEVVNRFFVQLGAVIIPRSVSHEHLAGNMDAFSWSLDETDMIALGWNPEWASEL